MLFFMRRSKAIVRNVWEEGGKISGTIPSSRGGILQKRRIEKLKGGRIYFFLYHKRGGRGRRKESWNGSSLPIPIRENSFSGEGRKRGKKGTAKALNFYPPQKGSERGGDRVFNLSQ